MKGGEMHHEHESINYDEAVRSLHAHLLANTEYGRYSVADAERRLPRDQAIKAHVEYLIDAAGIGDQELSEDEQRFLEWMAGWDGWTIETAGSILLRARASSTARILCAPEIMGESSAR
jgi:hypothetical protein